MDNGSADRLKIDGEEFTLVDEIDGIPIVDSFVKNNKIGRGSGEARLYVGAQTKMDFAAFFNQYRDQGFFLRRDLDQYLDDAKFEYEEQEQEYQKDISSDWQVYKNQLASLDSREYFSFEAAVGARDPARYYIRSTNRSAQDIFYGFFRCILLPTISYVSILKLKRSNGEYLFLFRPALSYSFNPYYHPAKFEQAEKNINEQVRTKKIDAERKTRLVDARYGQGAYRQRLLNESTECLITRVNDERLLIASHIKPWVVSNDDEKIDHNNGLVLTPTYDKLFDQGFISFTDTGEIMISAHISPLNLKKLGLAKGRKYPLPVTKKRLEYLQYHRSNIFKD